MSTTSSAEKRREASPDDRFGLCMHDFLRGWWDDTDNRLAVGWEASAKFWGQSHSVLKKETNAVWPAIENYSMKEIMTGKGPYRLQGVVWSWSLQPMCFQDTLLCFLFPIYPPNLTSRHETIYQNDSVCLIDSLTPNSDKHLISPYNITTESHIGVMRIKEMITNQRNSWLLDKLSLSAPQ